MSRIKEGDRVRCVVNYPRNNKNIEVGDEGVVVNINTLGSVGVDWGKNVGGHTCDGRCPDKRGYYIDKEDVSLAKTHNWKEVIVGE